jgi:hypothetical protein
MTRASSCQGLEMQAIVLLAHDLFYNNISQFSAIVSHVVEQNLPIPRDNALPDR